MANHDGSRPATEQLAASKVAVALRAGLGDVEGVFYKVEETPRRPPGFIIQILVVIPDSDRDLEYKVYAALGKLMRDNRKLLIDLHIVKRRGREVGGLIPAGFRQAKT